MGGKLVLSAVLPPNAPIAWWLLFGRPTHVLRTRSEHTYIHLYSNHFPFKTISGFVPSTIANNSCCSF